MEISDAQLFCVIFYSLYVRGNRSIIGFKKCELEKVNEIQVYKNTLFLFLAIIFFLMRGLRPEGLIKGQG